mgnify:FL=1
MIMQAVVIEVQWGRLLVLDLDARQRVLVNTPDASRFRPGDTIRIWYDGVMTASIPPQINAWGVAAMPPHEFPPTLPPPGAGPPVVCPPNGCLPAVRPPVIFPPVIWPPVLFPPVVHPPRPPVRPPVHWPTPRIRRHRSRRSPP